MKTKYHVQIPEGYMEAKYPDWYAISSTERKKRYELLLNQINAFLNGRNGSRAIVSGFGQKYEGIKIMPITPTRKRKYSAVSERSKMIKSKREQRKYLRSILEDIRLNPYRISRAASHMSDAIDAWWHGKHHGKTFMLGEQAINERIKTSS